MCDNHGPAGQITRALMSLGEPVFRTECPTAVVAGERERLLLTTKLALQMLTTNPGRGPEKPLLKLILTLRMSVGHWWPILVDQPEIVPGMPKKDSPTAVRLTLAMESPTPTDSGDGG